MSGGQSPENGQKLTDRKSPAKDTQAIAGDEVAVGAASDNVKCRFGALGAARPAGISKPKAPLLAVGLSAD